MEPDVTTNFLGTVPILLDGDHDLTNGGALFVAPAHSASPIAVIWVHGSGVNFYHPNYVKIGRELARRGLTTITVNTRMHDLGTIAVFR